METPASYGIVSPPRWHEVWIVAGGPSRRLLDPRALIGKRVLAVNDAIFDLPFPLSYCSNPSGVLSSGAGAAASGPPTEGAVAFFSLDNVWVRRHRDFLTQFPGEKYVALPLETWPECGGIRGVTYLQWSYERKLSLDPRVICTGGNSGYGALNLAFLKGAEEIHLVGYDMNPVDDEKYNDWIPYFRYAARDCQEHRVRVINHNRFSHIDAFEKV